jgi:signal transduction histidine kinase
MPGPYAPRADWRHDGEGGEGWDGPRGPFLPPGVRLWLPVVLSFFIQIMAVSWQLWRSDATRLESAAAVALAVAGPIALIGARRFPGPVVAIAAAAAATDLLVNPGLNSPYVALAFSIVLAMIRGARLWAAASVVTAWIVVLIGASMLGISWFPGQIIGTTIGLLIVFGIGEFVRSRRARYTERRREAVQRRSDAAQQERVRIARELHDVLAHSLSQINVQAGVGLHLIETQPQAAADALASIKSTSKTALDEVRSVLGVLRSGDSGAEGVPLLPQADLSRLGALVSAVSSPGLRIELDDHIRTPPPSAVQLALYRIAQESLTNVVRHSGASSARVELFETDGEYVLRVTDNGAGAPAARMDAAEAGKGLLGMAERAELLGGRLEAANRDGTGANGGGFGITATIPRERQVRAQDERPDAPAGQPAGQPAGEQASQHDGKQGESS